MEGALTVDRAHLLATPGLDAHATYVALSRHRQDVQLHYGRDDFDSPERLARVLGRERAKDSTLDYREVRERFADERGYRRSPDPAAERSVSPDAHRRSPFAGLNLGRATDRVPGLSRLIAFDGSAVTFGYKDYRRSGPDRRQVMTLSSDEFIRRFLRHPDGDAVAVSSVWTLDADELASIAKVIGAEVVTTDSVTISRRYGHALQIEVDLDFAKALEHLYARFGLDKSERAVLAAADSTSKLIEVLGQLSSPTERHTELQAHLAKAGSATNQARKLILSMVPKFMYFAAYDRMDGAIQLEQTRNLIANGQIDGEAYRGAKLFADFLDYAGVSIEDITQVTTYETFNARLQAASNNITDQVLEYWTQNPDLSVVVRVEQARPGDAAPLNQGTVAWARILNGLHRVDTPFSKRSAGFVWFFSFLVKFAQVQNDDTPVVLLLDEPGLTLHGKAQADLLRFFKEKLAPHHQIIYSTHSPFMVAADELTSVRIVEDKVEMKGPRRVPIGTKVREDVLTRDPDTLFPLQGALGYAVHGRSGSTCDLPRTVLQPLGITLKPDRLPLRSRSDTASKDLQVAGIGSSNRELMFVSSCPVGNFGKTQSGTVLGKAWSAGARRARKGVFP